MFKIPKQAYTAEFKAQAVKRVTAVAQNTVIRVPFVVVPVACGLFSTAANPAGIESVAA